MASERQVVLITGANGRIGRAATSALCRKFAVVGLDRSCGRRSHCIAVDLAADESVDRALREFREKHGGRIAAVIHLAAYFDFSGEPNPLYETVNVHGTQRLLHALQSFQVEQFVYASTMLVHAPTEPGIPLDEDWPLAPKWPYPESKVAAEQTVRALHGRIPYVILRIAGVYTDYCDVPALAHQIQRVHERQFTSHVFPGDASHGQALVYLDDLAQALTLVVQRRAELPGDLTLLVGEPVTETYAALQNQIGRLLHGERWNTREIPKAVAATGAWLQGKMEEVVPDAIDGGVEPFVKPFMIAFADDHYELDISRATRLLGWKPRHTLREMLPRIVATLQADPVAWYRRNGLPLPARLAETADQPVPAERLIHEHDALERREFQQTLWCHFANIALGLWLLASPATFGATHLPTLWNDILSGLLIAFLGLLSMSRHLGWARWAAAAVGTWLLFAPLAFWEPSAAAYANDTLVGALVVVFAVIVPPTPGIGTTARMAGPDIPPGWDASPSSWSQRLPIVALALVGLLVSRYLAAYQLGHTKAAWDPLFGSGTEDIINSYISEAWPVSDAGLGAMTYMLEILTGIIGDKRRWRTMPWMVLLFGVMIVPLGAVSIFFIVIQPILLGAWCTLCLVAAAAMILQIPYSFDEVLATLQFLKDRLRRGKPFWRTVLRGDSMEGDAVDDADNFEAPLRRVVDRMIHGGVTFPWTLWASAAIGAALMCTRLLFDAHSQAADSDHLMGSLVITFSVMAFAEVGRALRYANVVFGAWLVVAPWLLAGYTVAGAAVGSLLGVLLILLARPRGAVHGHYGEWDGNIK